MLPAPILARAVDSGMIRRVDRRSHPRYPIVLKLSYQLTRTNGVKHLGFGRTLDITSGGVLVDVSGTFEASDIPLARGEIQLDVDWPFLLDEVCRLKLVVRGRIVRWDDICLAVKREQHEFRTAGSIARS